MKYDGVVARIKAVEDKFFLFLVDPDGIMHDGINISDHRNIYEELTYDQLMVVNVILKDGTMEMETIDLDEFIHGDKYPRENIYLYIQDILLYTIGKDKTKTTKIADILKRGEFSDVAFDCIGDASKQAEDLKKKLT